jgi:hypothetical protein
VRVDDLAVELDVDVQGPRELLDQVVRHALVQVCAAAEDRHAARVLREVERGLSRGVARADDVDVEPVDLRRLAARGAVRDPFACEAVEAVDVQLSPRDSAGEDDRRRAQDVAAVETHMVVDGVDVRDLPRDDDLGAEPPCLLQRPSGELVAGDAAREAEIVLDARRRARLPSRCLALDHDRPETLGGPVDGCRQARPAAAHDQDVVVRRPRLGVEAEQLGDAPELRPDDDLAAFDDPDRRAVLVRRERPAPERFRVGVIAEHPGVAHLVAIEKAAEPPTPCRASAVLRR